MPVILTIDDFPFGVGAAGAAVTVFARGSGSGVLVHEALPKNPLGAGMNWRELTTPGAETVPTREKDLSFESSFHIRMAPSHDPK